MINFRRYQSNLQVDKKQTDNQSFYFLASIGVKLNLEKSLMYIEKNIREVVNEPQVLEIA